MRNRTDKNQSEIVKVLQQVGASVHDLSQAGEGVPDLLVGYFGKNYLIEVKDENKKIRLTSAQKIFHEFWKGKVYIVQTKEEALKILGIEL